MGGRGQTVDGLVTDADVAMYAAKSAGRSRVERFSGPCAQTSQSGTTWKRPFAVRSSATSSNSSTSHSSISTTGEIAGAEALIRWSHHEHGVLMPARFIPIAEESELIVLIGRMVLRRASQDVARFRRIAGVSAELRVAVNLSARHLLSPELVSDVASRAGCCRHHRPGA